MDARSTSRLMAALAFLVCLGVMFIAANQRVIGGLLAAPFFAWLLWLER